MKRALLTKLKQRYPNTLRDIKQISFTKLSRHNVSMCRFRDTKNYDSYRSFKNPGEFLAYLNEKEGLHIIPVRVK